MTRKECELLWRKLFMRYARMKCPVCSSSRSLVASIHRQSYGILCKACFVSCYFRIDEYILNSGRDYVHNCMSQGLDLCFNDIIRYRCLKKLSEKIDNSRCTVCNRNMVVFEEKGGDIRSSFSRSHFLRAFCESCKARSDWRMVRDYAKGEDDIAPYDREILEDKKYLLRTMVSPKELLRRRLTECAPYDK